MRNVLVRVVVGLGCWFAWAAGGGAQEPDALRAFGDHLFRQGDYYRAITEYERFAFLAPEHPDVAQVRLRIGEAYYFGEKWDAAARMFRALETPETDRDVQRTAALYLAAVAMQQKDLQRASDLLERFLRDQPPEQPLFLEAAMLAARLGQNGNALRYLETALYGNSIQSVVRAYQSPAFRGIRLSGAGDDLASRMASRARVAFSAPLPVEDISPRRAAPDAIVR